MCPPVFIKGDRPLSFECIEKGYKKIGMDWAFAAPHYVLELINNLTKGRNQNFKKEQ